MSVPCPVPGCGAEVRLRQEGYGGFMCEAHMKKVPPYWLRRWEQAVKKYEKSKQLPTHERVALLKDREFCRDACVGAAMNQER